MSTDMNLRNNEFHILSCYCLDPFYKKVVWHTSIEFVKKRVWGLIAGNLSNLAYFLSFRYIYLQILKDAGTSKYS